MRKTFEELYTANNTILDIMTFPDGIDSTVAKDTITGRIWHCELIYEDANTFQLFARNWCNTRNLAMQHLVKIAAAEYNPIENYDRHETVQRTGTHNIEKTETGEHERNTSSEGTETRDTSANGTTTSTTNGNAENLISADNATEYQSDTKSVTSGSDNATTTNTGKDAGSRTEKGNETGNTSGSSTEDGTNEETITSHMHGNIGVTTNQQMIEAELKLLPTLNIYEWIARDFEAFVCVGVY